MTWPEAQIYCRQHHTDLATIRTQIDIDLLTTMIGKDTHAWIGLFRDSWKWSDGSKVPSSSIRWKSSSRNTSGKDQRPCGTAGPDGLIVDQFCSDLLPFICLKYSRKQIVRTEIKSGLNLNDPAVMEKILQLIKQKLKDHGIEKETTLTWRLQPDGNVFSPKHEDIRAPVQCHRSFF
ncbi:asialoglycoprotein receptor 2-like [Paramisgurnus dabryanus]|uniref:asialoglycoprotein receptor 2-like n=1 Tax=Paramisgurnus dabryanus TaxID=90735 RepID=UPI003CCF9653